MAGTERRRELRRRRQRRQKLANLKGRLQKANESEKQEIVRKIRELSPGAEELIARWELEAQDR